MRAEAALSEFVTVALAYVVLGAGGDLRVRLALGGHPPPMVLRADGRVEELAEFGAVLGVVPDPELPDTETVLGPGDTLVMYTDGVTEAGPRAAPLGEDGLARLLSARAGMDPEALLGAVEEAAVAAQPGEPRDDIALLAVAVERGQPA
jgi:serine phosphatase RsbU (regulator of sigma subunit)